MSAGSARLNGKSLWPRVAGLRLVIEACEYERLHSVLAYEFERITTHVRLVGAGAWRLGEDVSVYREDGTALHEARPELSLAGDWTLAGFCEHLATLELWPDVQRPTGLAQREIERCGLERPGGALRQLARPR